MHPGAIAALLAVPVIAGVLWVAPVQPGVDGCSSVGDASRDPFVTILCRTEFHGSRDGILTVQDTAASVYITAGHEVRLAGPPLDWEDLWVQVDGPGVRVAAPDGSAFAPPGIPYKLDGIGSGPLEAGQRIRFCHPGTSSDAPTVWLGAGPRADAFDESARGTLSVSGLAAC